MLRVGKGVIFKNVTRSVLTGRSGHVREAGGAFSAREAAQEDRYVWEQEKAAIMRLREQLAQQEARAAKNLEVDPMLDPQFANSINQAQHASYQSSGSANAEPIVETQQVRYTWTTTVEEPVEDQTQARNARESR
ncbi:hypothetical protein HDU85_006919 [Gaertneriomyces sp. JEL0708]|nr:hypothetical protein HDU85_006919 [Gaertneriomyces sp. JEL0708]